MQSMRRMWGVTGVSETLGGLEVSVVSNNFSTFDGLVNALEDAFRRK
jgi:hypothetical protein